MPPQPLPAQHEPARPGLVHAPLTPSQLEHIGKKLFGSVVQAAGADDVDVGGGVPIGA